MSLGRLLIALACTFVPLTFTNAVFTILGPHLPGAALLGPALPFAVYAVGNVVGVGAVFALLGRERLRALGVLLRFSRKKVMFALGAFALGVAVFGVVDVVLRQVGLATVRGMPVAPSGSALAGLLLTVVLIVPLCEEVLFRAVWYGALRPRVGPFVAGACATAAFAAIHLPHFGIGGVIFIALWTLLPIALYARFDDITSSWLMHALNNAFAYLVAPLFSLQEKL